MPMYEMDSRSLLVPHVVSAVQRSERALTIRVVVQNIAGAEVPADVTLAAPAGTEQKAAGSLPVREEVVTFLRGLQTQLDGLLPGATGTTKPRKALDYWQKGAGTTVSFRVHFGGYERDTWSPIRTGVSLTALDTAARDQWIQNLVSVSGRLPLGTKITEAGPRSVDALKAIEWASARDLTDSLATTIVTDFRQFVDAIQPFVASALGTGQQ